MDLHLKNPDLQAKVERWAAETGRSADELAEDAIAGYLEGLAEVRATLDSRYDDLESGRRVAARALPAVLNEPPHTVPVDVSHAFTSPF
jgi:hypothetical protein